MQFATRSTKPDYQLSHETELTLPTPLSADATVGRAHHDAHPVFDFELT